MVVGIFRLSTAFRPTGPVKAGTLSKELRMARLTYSHHTILSTPVCHEHSGMWRFAASVASPEMESARGDRLFFSSPELFIRFEDAEKAGVEAAKNWIDGRANKAFRTDLPTRQSPR
jgi:hypothetical protein